MAVDKYTVFFKRECEVILNKVADTIYDNLEALQCIPLAPAEGPGVRPRQQVLRGVTPKYSLTPFSDFSIVVLWR